MSHHALDAGDGRLVGRVTKRLANGRGLNLVVDFGTCPVCVDVLDVFRVEARIPHGHADAGDGTATFGMNVGDAVGVGRRSVANDFPVDLSSPLQSVFKFFEDHHAGSLAEHEAIAIAIEWARCSLGIGVVRRECGEQIESGHTERMNHAVRAAGQHRVGIATTDEFRRFADRLT